MKSFIDFMTGLRANHLPRLGTHHEILNAAAIISWFGAIDGLHTTVRPNNETMESWFDGGQLHRTDGPALVTKDAAGNVLSQQWFQNGRRYRAGGGPDVLIVQHVDGEKTETRQWYDAQGRLRHELTTCPTSRGQAYKEFFYDENGKRHRDKGPAWFVADARGEVVTEEWYLHGARIDPPLARSGAEI
jgi:YD repeat-containing protein